MSKLTQKQENFCLKLMECGSQSEAYRYAYDAENMAQKTIWERASVLASKDKVKARINELRSKQEEIALYTIEDKKRLLWEMINEARSKEDYNAAKGCLNELNKMDGDHAPVKSESKEDIAMDINVTFGKS